MSPGSRSQRGRHQACRQCTLRLSLGVCNVWRSCANSACRACNGYRPHGKSTQEHGQRRWGCLGDQFTMQKLCSAHLMQRHAIICLPAPVAPTAAALTCRATRPQPSITVPPCCPCPCSPLLSRGRAAAASSAPCMCTWSLMRCTTEPPRPSAASACGVGGWVAGRWAGPLPSQQICRCTRDAAVADVPRCTVSRVDCWCTRVLCAQCRSGEVKRQIRSS